MATAESQPEMFALAESTNEARSKSPPLQVKKLRRMRPFKRLYRDLDSSETLPSFHESIWDADRERSHDVSVSGSGDLSEGSPDNTSGNASGPLEKFPSLSTSSLETSNQFAGDAICPPGLSVPPLRSRSISASTVGLSHQPTQLEPIAEQCSSVASIQCAHVESRLGHTPRRHTMIVRPQQSYHSIHPIQRSKSAVTCGKIPLGLSKPSRRRVLSLDELEFPVFRSFGCSGMRWRSAASSSLDECPLTTGQGRDAVPTAPRLPPHQPPVRSATPPGVPSFGTPEATSYLSPSGASILSLWRRSSSPRRNQLGAATPASAATTALAASFTGTNVCDRHQEPPQRRLSTAGINETREIMSAPRRATMPACVLRADDGTSVRGHFGGRVSGHGIGPRNLDTHPLQRMAAFPNGSKITARESGQNVLPRQRDKVRKLARRNALTSDAVTPARGAPHSSCPSAGPSSRKTSWWSPNRSAPPRNPDEMEMSERVPSGHIDLAADRAQIFGPSRVATRNSSNELNNRDHYEASSAPNFDQHASSRPPHQPSISKSTTSSQSRSPFWHCWRLFCICCCDYTTSELDGAGWAGADRPWTRLGRRQASLKRKRDQDRERRQHNWNNASALRREIAQSGQIGLTRFGVESSVGGVSCRGGNVYGIDSSNGSGGDDVGSCSSPNNDEGAHDEIGSAANGDYGNGIRDDHSRNQLERSWIRTKWMVYRARGSEEQSLQ